MSVAIGIDIGTANTRVAVFRNGDVEIIPDADGHRLMPSYVAFTEHARLFGGAAKTQAASNITNTVYDIKRLIGRKESEAEIQQLRRYMPCQMQTLDGKLAIRVDYKQESRSFTAMEIYGMLMARARANAEAYLGEPVGNAVISVPVYFNQDQRQDVRDAALLAGLNALGIFNSIDSLMTYYGFTLFNSQERLVAILDLGAGFFNVGLAVIEEGILEIVGSASDNFLGGEDFVTRMENHFSAEIKRKWEKDIGTNLRAKRRLRSACEVAMRDLSVRKSTELDIESLLDGRDFSSTITRARFEELCQDLFRSTILPIERAIGDSKREKSTIQEIVLVGGCSRIPKIQELWRNFFEGRPLVKSIHPDEGEVCGSAIYAEIYSGGRDKCRRVGEMLLLPASPISIGIETAGGLMTKIVPRNTTCPTKKSESFTLEQLGISDQLPRLKVYEGERARVKDNALIGWVDLRQLSPSDLLYYPETTVEVTVDLDHTYRPTVRLRQVRSERPITWQRKFSTSKEKLERLLVEAENFQEEDTAEEARTAERCALDSHIASLQAFQPPQFRTRRMDELLKSLEAIRSWADENGTAPISEYRQKLKNIEMISRDLKAETLRAADITDLQSRINGLREKILSTSQTPKVITLFDSVNLIASWMGQNEAAEAWEYELKHRQVDNISSDLTKELQEMRRTKPVPLRSGPSQPDTSQTGQSAVSESTLPDELLNPSEISSSRPSRHPTPVLDEQPQIGASPHFSAGEGLGRLFPESGWSLQHRYTDAEFEDIASYLRNTGHTDWSSIPRIYTVLRLLGQIDFIRFFLNKEMTDIWFPFSDNTLPKSIQQPHRAQFLEIQVVVFSKALHLEKGSKLDEKGRNRKHAHFSREEPLPFKVVANLGGGAHGFVDKVISVLSHKEYARKRFKRSVVINKKDLKTFFNELKILKMLSYRHCVELIGSYSDPRDFALIITPVADCNLEKYYNLAMADEDKKSLLRGFFGCLAGTLDYLHRSKIVHQDIKPQNILVKDHNVLLTDFGISRSWEGLTRSTTTADLDRSWMYAAPEVARGGPKNELADVWSLGCVFLEMCTVLKGMSVISMRAFFKEKSDSTSFHDNSENIAAWMDRLRQQAPIEDNAAIEWVASMLQVQQKHRSKPFELFDRALAESERTRTLFCGACCLYSGDFAPDTDDQPEQWSDGEEETTS